MDEGVCTFKPFGAYIFLVPIGILGSFILCPHCLSLWIYKKDYFEAICFSILLFLSIYIFFRSIIAYNLKIKFSIDGIVIVNPLLHQYEEEQWSSIRFGYYTSFWSKDYLVLSYEKLDKSAVKKLARKAGVTTTLLHFKIENHLVLCIHNVHGSNLDKLKAILQNAISIQKY